MRESIGATWIFSLVLIFIVLFTSYLAISVNYAKAFKIKNHIATMIENNEGYKAGDGVAQNIQKYIVSEGYQAHGACPCNAKFNDGDQDQTNWQMVACIDGNNGNQYGTVPSKCAGSSSTGNVDCAVAIYKIKDTSMYSGTKLDVNNPTCAARTYYKVTTFFKFDLPVISTFTTFKVNGETKTIYDFTNAPPTC